MKSKGLGDSIAKFTKAIKLDKLVNAVTIGDCGCNYFSPSLLVSVKMENVNVKNEV